MSSGTGKRRITLDLKFEQVKMLSAVATALDDSLVGAIRRSLTLVSKILMLVRHGGHIEFVDAEGQRERVNFFPDVNTLYIHEKSSELTEDK